VRQRRRFRKDIVLIKTWAESGAKEHNRSHKRARPRRARLRPHEDLQDTVRLPATKN